MFWKSQGHRGAFVEIEGNARRGGGERRGVYRKVPTAREVDLGGVRARSGHRGAHDWSAAGVLPLLCGVYLPLIRHRRDTSPVSPTQPKQPPSLRLSDERDRALGELRTARERKPPAATPLALAGSRRRDNANLRRALQQARAEVQSLRRRPPQGISDASRRAAEALRRELGGSAPDAKRVDALKERIARLESERDALRKQLARAPKASVELNALRAEVQAARDEALRARTDLAAGGDLSDGSRRPRTARRR